MKYEEFLCPCLSLAVGVSSWKLVEKGVQQMCLGGYWPHLCVGGRFGHVDIWRAALIVYEALTSPVRTLANGSPPPSAFPLPCQKQTKGATFRMCVWAPQA